MHYRELLNQIYDKKSELNSLLSIYWNHYSNLGTWQFWVIVATLILPLVLLYFTVDRRRIFEIFFFGYTIHVLWTYSDIVLEKYNLFIHTYLLAPFFPIALNMTTSVLPVGFLLVYQYCTNRQKNFYLYTLVLSAFFSFVLGTIEYLLGMSEFKNGMNEMYLFLIDVVVTYVSYWFTKFIKKLVPLQ
ncbi:hypothetical protein PU629_20695 [Pullulanibacillus sp. KACC 23026]|uniref:hypothetical protein n=1 Tax=Pullulanibacillus sp. KACC 23026 TaxID=3028315 RepID=UPI0023AEFA86|nr:hypothetical protein [Pullulanibacillus sp. KACC 23026]WEG12488.1 hypothetical protein PU629_20695 [Pullulanibacillus sp. KACC 23026]